MNQPDYHIDMSLDLYQPEREVWQADLGLGDFGGADAAALAGFRSAPEAEPKIPAANFTQWPITPFPSQALSLQPPSEEQCLEPQLGGALAASTRPQSLESSLNPGFRFESGAVVIQDNRKSPKRVTTTPESVGFKCDYPGCKSKRSFKRRYELQRHMVKHTDRNKYSCPITTCEKTFYREDKIKSHFVQTHRDDDRGICPISSCAAGPMALALFNLHIRNHLYFVARRNFFYSNKEPGRLCPINTCKMFIASSGAPSIQEMQSHIRTHGLTERHENREPIEKAGYHFSTADLVCPMCQQTCKKVEEFQAHVRDSHLDQKLTGPSQEIVRRYDWLEWNSKWVLCSCPWAQQVANGASLSSELLRGNVPHSPCQHYDAIAPHLPVILRFWPEFSTHPLFDLYMPTVDGAYWRTI